MTAQDFTRNSFAAKDSGQAQRQDLSDSVRDSKGLRQKGEGGYKVLILNILHPLSLIRIWEPSVSGQVLSLEPRILCSLASSNDFAVYGFFRNERRRSTRAYSGTNPTP